jgi:hypothetical protein
MVGNHHPAFGDITAPLSAMPPMPSKTFVIPFFQIC